VVARHWQQRRRQFRVQQRDVIDYLREKNRVLREELGPRRL
jgi:hypothetical protein